MSALKHIFQLLLYSLVIRFSPLPLLEVLLPINLGFFLQIIPFPKLSAFPSISPNHGHGPSTHPTAHVRKQKQHISLNWRLSREDTILNKEKMLYFSLHLSTLKEHQAFFMLGSTIGKALDLKKIITIIVGKYALKGCSGLFVCFFLNQPLIAVSPDEGKSENI